MSSTARIEVRIEPQSKDLIERAAALTHRSVTTFVTEVVVARAREVVEGPAHRRADHARPIGGWSFHLPEGWDAPIDDLAEYR